jgi:hypothetical protein
MDAGRGGCMLTVWFYDKITEELLGESVRTHHSPKMILL